ncbi:MAG TPA: pseudaminic acid cytidylyltransferase [Ideonella sp.]|nr:pseudaminic acid cytidylyltransferase [Ideonella sp.]
MSAAGLARAVAVIPARGGSQRIPRKNVRPFAGKPMIAWSIAAALESGLFDRVVVSTDDDEIAEVARAHGAEVPFRRPAALAGHHTATRPVVIHALQTLGITAGSHPHTCTLAATAPFVSAADLARGVAMLVEQQAEFAFSVARYTFPIQRALRLNAEGRVEMFQPEHRLTRSQDLEPAFHDAGQFYWGLTGSVLADRPTFSPLSVPVLLPEHRVQDIDTPEDWARAERLFRLMEAA